MIDRPEPSGHRWTSYGRGHRSDRGREFERSSRTVHARDSSRFERTLALSNGVFAISLTLLVLSVAVPTDTPGAELGGALVELVPTLVAFALTVFIVGLYWRNHNDLFDSLAGVDGTLFGLNVGYLALVALVPFPNDLIGSYPGEPVAYAVFATVIAGLAVMDTAMFVHARRRGLLREGVTDRTYRVDLLRGTLTVLVFVASVPLAFVLGPWTPVIWVSLLAADAAIDAATPGRRDGE